MTTFLGFLFFSIDIGLALGVGLSQVILFAYSSAVSCSQIEWEIEDDDLQERQNLDVNLVEEEISKASGMVPSDQTEPTSPVSKICLS